MLAACVVGPFVFAAAMAVQSALPEDTLFGRAVKESGFAIPLVILGFAALWVFPALTSVVGGDLFSAEDRYGTWATVLTRSRSRAEVFGGKVLTAFGFSLLAVTCLAVSSVAAGVLVIGVQPLINLSGVMLSPADALAPRHARAGPPSLPPVFGFTALSVLLSVATRSSAAGIGLPVLTGLAMQGYAFIDGPEPVRQSAHRVGVRRLARALDRTCIPSAARVRSDRQRYLFRRVPGFRVPADAQPRYRRIEMNGRTTRCISESRSQPWHSSPRPRCGSSPIAPEPDRARACRPRLRTWSTSRSRRWDSRRWRRRTSR